MVIICSIFKTIFYRCIFELLRYQCKNSTVTIGTLTNHLVIGVGWSVIVKINKFVIIRSFSQCVFLRGTTKKIVNMC